MRKLKPVTPGELLWEEFLVPMALSQYRLAKEIGVPAQRIGEIVAGKRAITADTDLRLCRFFGLSNGYWLRAQAAYDTEVAEDALAEELAQLAPRHRLDAHEALDPPAPGQGFRVRILERDDHGQIVTPCVTNVKRGESTGSEPLRPTRPNGAANRRAKGGEAD